MASNLSWKIIKNWKEKVAAHQQTLSCYFADRLWDGLHKSSDNFQYDLQVKLSNALFNKIFLNCTIEEQNIINATAIKVIELSGKNINLHLGYTYIFTLSEDFKENIAVVLRTSGSTYYGKDLYFLESQPNGSIYCGWSAYVTSNKLPPCHMCYPKGGFYKKVNGKVLIEFQKSPSCSYTLNPLKLLDYIPFGSSTVSCTLSEISVFFPAISLPEITFGSSVIFRTATAYNATRNIYDLHDRSTHHQNISPDDEKARSLWLKAVINIEGATAAISNPESLDTVARSNFKILYNVLFALNGFGILNKMLNIIVKLSNGDLQSTDIDCFAQSCIFIGNVRMTPRMVEGMIKTLSNQPRRFKNMLNMVKNTRFDEVKFIIDSCDVELSFIIKILAGPALQVGLRVMNPEYTAQFFHKFRVSILQYYNNEIGLVELYLKLFAENKFLFKFVDEMKDVVRSITFWGDLKIDTTRIFENSSPLLAIDINAILNSMTDNLLDCTDTRDTFYNDELLRIATTFAKDVTCNTDIEFVEICSLFANKITSDCNKKLIAAANDSCFLTFYSVSNHITGSYDVFLKMSEEYHTVIQNTINYDKSYLKSPVYQTHAGEMYIFSQETCVTVFDQFIHDTVCELLNVQSIFEKGTFYYCDIDDLNLFIIGYETKSVIFYYTLDNLFKCVLGFVILLN